MCGDLESDEQLAEDFYARFVDHAHAFLAGVDSETTEEEADSLYVHLDTLFRETLTASTKGDTVQSGVSGYERLCMEPLVFARLAGFMAAHQPLEDDPLRRLLEAMMTGYAEGEETMTVHDQQHIHGHTH
jgi:hypothetical protein